MTLFELKKANAFTRLVDFQQQPIWEELVSEIEAIYRIPSDRVEIAFLDRKGETVVINNNEGLLCFYESSYQPPEVPKFVVQDMEVPDG
jgi:hypothetical protein